MFAGSSTGSGPAASWSPAWTIPGVLALLAGSGGAGRRRASSATALRRGRRRPDARCARPRRARQLADGDSVAGRRLADAGAGRARRAHGPQRHRGAGCRRRTRLRGDGVAARAGRVHRGPPPVRVQGPGRRGGALRRLRAPSRPRWRPSWRPPAAWSATAGWWWCSSRTCTPAPRPSPTSSATPSRWPTWSCELDVYGAREQPLPGVSGELIADRGPAGPPGRLSADLGRRGVHRRGTAAARRPGASPWVPAT